MTSRSAFRVGGYLHNNDIMPQAFVDPQSPKQILRQQVLALRRQQPDKDLLSEVICGKVAALPQYRQADAVMSYVGVRSEVRTWPFLEQVLHQGKTLVVPYCVGQHLELFRLESMDELAQGYFGLWEPRTELRTSPDKQIDVTRIDLVMVPGIVFDRQGGRIGHGKGYYDRLLATVRPEACLVGVAFQCQIVPTVPLEPYDVSMDLVITETTVEQGRGPRGRRASDT